MKHNDILEYLAGKALYGNNMSLDEIEQWYKEEAEGYANLGSKNKETYIYDYHTLNQALGFSHIKGLRFENALGIGSAWGYEFEPIIDRVKNLTIVEPSENMISDKIGHLVPKYIKPSIDGRLPFNDNSFDLITCFGTLHHIPNVSFVLNELIRVLAPGGHILLREPIVSMGDWRNNRPGLTRNERGIPVEFFEKEFAKLPIEVISRRFCFTLTTIIQNKIGSFFKKAVYSYRLYILFDQFVSNLLKKNVTYHAAKKLEKIAPSSIYYVLKKRIQ